MIIDTPEGIAFYKLLLLKQGLKAQKIGLRMSSRAPQATTIARRQYGLKGNLASLTTQVEAMIEEAIAARQSTQDQ